MSTIHKSDIDMSGLLQILGENLYSTPSVAIRELVQNAHDACHRRKIEDPQVATQKIDAKIWVYTQPSSNKLIIEDNGSGLTHEEIIQFLATIGTGYTRKLRNDSALNTPSINNNEGSMQEQLVGYFGLGFLSSYVVAEKVKMYTTSFQAPEETWCFISRGGEQYVLEKHTDTDVPIGTRLELTLKDNFSEFSDIDVVTRLIKNYCCLLPIPIIDKERQTVINELQPPWRMVIENKQQLKQQQFAFAQLFEPNFEPICTLPIQIKNTDGLLWIQDAGFFSTSDSRKVSVFIRNMFISSDIKSLLPTWAGFIGCVINTTALTPTASREDIQKNHDFDELKQKITEQLITGLLHISEKQPEHWRRILLRHNTALLGAAVSDSRLMSVLQHKLTIPTTMGDMSISDVLAKGNGKLYIRPENKHGYEDALFRARQIPVVQGWMFAVARFCDSYALHKVVELGKSDSLNSVFELAEATEAEMVKLKNLLVAEDEQVRLVNFEPSFIPLIYTEDQEILLKKRMESDDMDKKIGAAALNLVRLHTKKIANKPARQVQINLKNSLIQRLLTTTNESQAKDVAVLLTSYMKALCIDPRGELNLEELTIQYTNMIEKLVFKQ